jgi:hypothetical protein
MITELAEEIDAIDWLFGPSLFHCYCYYCYYCYCLLILRCMSKSFIGALLYGWSSELAEFIDCYSGYDRGGSSIGFESILTS